ncbi:MAG TPA: hypothetical protein VED66_15615 [Candidatus Sulfotelmatobacter sp.]|nr:hypothetical protein [Candidatus Sulfotelmatobacter sp.]
MTFVWKIFFFGLSASIILFTAWLLFYPKPVPKNEQQALEQAIVHMQDSRYDSAVHVLEQWMTNTPRNFSHDDFLYQQIAMIYIQKAYKEPKTKSESIYKAASNLDRAQSLLDRNQTGELDVMLFEIGGGYAILGDLSNENKCQFYEKARQDFVRQLTLIKGDSYTAYGKTIPLGRVRAEVRRHLDEVNTKFSSASCQTNE